MSKARTAFGAQSTRCDGVVIVHADSSVSCTEIECVVSDLFESVTNGHAAFVPCFIALDPCPRCKPSPPG